MMAAQRKVSASQTKRRRADERWNPASDWRRIYKGIVENQWDGIAYDPSDGSFRISDNIALERGWEKHLRHRIRTAAAKKAVQELVEKWGEDLEFYSRQVDNPLFGPKLSARQTTPARGGIAHHAGTRKPSVSPKLKRGWVKQGRASDIIVRDTPMGRMNPAAAADAAFREFHGHDSKELVTVKRKVHRHEHLAGAGELRGLSVKPVGQGPVRHIGGLKKAILAFNEGMNQLFIEGGDQFLSDAELLKFGVRKPIHELETLGKVTALDYFTTKSHLGDEGGTAVYAHKLRTTNEDGRHVTVKIARYPDLIYRVLDQQMEFSGGSYEIRAEGIDK